jgi:hypothetical protein
MNARPSGTQLFVLTHGGFALWIMFVVWLAVVRNDFGYTTLVFLPIVLFLLSVVRVLGCNTSTRT